MLFNRYEQAGLLFNTNVKEAAGSGSAYRGEIVIQPGEVGDAQGRRKQPHAVIKQGVALSDGEKLRFVSGSLDQLQHLRDFMDIYKGDLANDARLVFFVVNIPKPLIVTVDGFNVISIPMVEGVAWNELMEMCGLEKGDFKGQSAGEKVITLYEAVNDLKPAYSAMAYADALGTTNSAKRDARGAV